MCFGHGIQKLASIAMKCNFSSQHKAAAIILVLNALVYSVVGGTHSLLSLFADEAFPDSRSKAQHLVTCILLIFEALVYPIGGWLADVYFGRYKVMRTCMWGMWGALLVLTAGLTLLYAYHDHYFTKVAVVYILVPVMSLAISILFPGFMVNVLAFLLDNLLSETSTTLQNYIYLYAWTFHFGMRTVSELLRCASSDTLASAILQFLSVTISMTLAVCIDLCMRQHLNTAFQPKNPLKLIRNVLCYAMKNKSPRNRSAFTYCEDDIPSRVDLAKSRYGGQFTEEEVDDVKTLGHIILLMPPFALACIAFYGSRFLIPIVSNSFEPLNMHSVCTVWHLALVYDGIVILGIPAYLLLSSSIRGYIQWRFGTMRRVSLGIVASVLCAVATLVLFLVHHFHSPNKLTTCKWTSESPGEANYWSLFLFALLGLAYITIFPPLNEFICAQTPSYMRGMLIGLGIATLNFARLLSFLVALPILPSSSLSCQAVYAIVIAAAAFSGLVLFVIFSRKYKLRERGQTVSVYRFADDYYSKLVENYPNESDPDAEVTPPSNIYTVH